MDNSKKKQIVDNSYLKEFDASKSDDEQMIEPNNKLGFALLNKVDPDENNNIFISPTSALFALLMAYNGADGDTQTEIAHVLQFHNMSVEVLNNRSVALIDMLEKDSGAIQLSIANSIWINKNFSFQDEYYNSVIDYYDAEVSEIDVADNSSVDKINHWVSESTNHKISEIIEAPLDQNLVAMLINALYFKGQWQYGFNEELTEELPFYSQVPAEKVPTMMLEEELMYMENDQFQAVKLPYGKGEMSMNVFLPNESFHIENFIAELTVDNWQKWNAAFRKMKGTIKLPKFQLEYETELNQALKQLGIELAFHPYQANFSKMINEDDPLWIDQVKQKTYIDVNEEGTEAAAVTSIEVVTESAEIPVSEDTFYMEVNRPFFIMITDDEKDAIVFLGIISNPEQTK